jgi:WD40 repeat protein
VPQGLWLVGLDGSRLRRIADVGRYSWSPDGTQVAVATDRIWILSAEDGHALSTVESGPPSTIVGCLDWSSKGTIGWVAQDGTVRFARATDRAATVVATGYPSTDDYLDDGCRWSPDGSLFATGGEGFVLFSPDGHRVVAAADPRAALTSHVKWSPDGRSLAAMTADHDARKTGVGVLSGQDWSHVDVVTPSSEVHRLTWTADGRKLLARTGDGLDAVDAAAGTVTVETTSCCLSVLTPLPGGDYLTVGGESMLRFVSGSWEPRGTLLTTDASATRCEGAFFASMRVSPNGRELVVEAQPRGGARCDKKHPS